jgi:hypothetical protein
MAPKVTMGYNNNASSRPTSIANLLISKPRQAAMVPVVVDSLEKEKKEFQLQQKLKIKIEKFQMHKDGKVANLISYIAAFKKDMDSFCKMNNCILSFLPKMKIIVPQFVINSNDFDGKIALMQLLGKITPEVLSLELRKFDFTNARVLQETIVETWRKIRAVLRMDLITQMCPSLTTVFAKNPYIFPWLGEIKTLTNTINID